MSDAETIELETLIDKARKYKMSKQDVAEQELSWVIGNASEGPRLTREEALSLLAD